MPWFSATPPLPFGLLLSAQFSLAARFFLGADPGLLFLDQPAIGRLHRFALAPLHLRLGGARFLGRFHLTPLSVDLFLGRAVLLLEHVSLDVGALDAHFHTHRAGASLSAGQFQLTLGLALERDAGRRRAAAGRTAPVAAAQMRQQLELGVLADQVVGSGDADTGLIKLRQQLVDRHLERLGKLANGDVSHVFAPRTRARAPS